MSDMRCECGRLMARQIPDGIELKCPRCKRAFVLRLPQRDAHGPARALRLSPVSAGPARRDG
ncbi:MAG: hypothetical protein HYY15_00035 [Candidatus Omnitrophica bacterium]|nr:hypothetical protein [Candidatus Omnitrophota bacterium]